MDKYGGTNCNSHPHNYYLEIATALGLLGLVIVISLFTYILIETLKTLHFRNHHTINTKLLIPFYALFIAEIFPFKTTGSFFTTSNATYLFLIISFIIALNENTKKIKK
jgi:O-antigen ligase